MYHLHSRKTVNLVRTGRIRVGYTSDYSMELTLPAICGGIGVLGKEYSWTADIFEREEMCPACQLVSHANKEAPVYQVVRSAIAAERVQLFIRDFQTKKRFEFGTKVEGLYDD